MNYRRLGNSALEISEVGLGCMSLGDDQQANDAVIHKAIDNGINFFDTADLYQKGNNETSLGRSVKEKRQKVVIATKVGNQWKPDGSGWNWNPRKEYILSAAEQSLKRLNTAYIDLYQLHGGTIEDPIDEVIDAFETLKEQGKIRFYGISSIRPNVIAEYVKRSSISSVMMQYSLLDRRPEETCLGLLQSKNIGVLARGSIAGGLLVDKPAKGYLQYNEAEVSKAAQALRLASGDHRTASQTAIRFVLQHPAITSAVVGCRTPQQLEDAVHAVSTAPLTQNEIGQLRSSIPVNKYNEHRQ